MARCRLGLRGSPLCWLPQQPSKMTTASEVAAPPRMARSRLGLRGTPMCCPPQQPSKRAIVSHFATLWQQQDERM
eukprot:6388097-Pyramimonas_sp.AAC.1